MQKRFIFGALAVAVLLTPVVLTIGAFVLIPLSLVVFPVLLVFGVAALPALLVSAISGAEPGAQEPTRPASRPRSPSDAIAYSR
ncbi:MAG: hypothetical protein E6J90_42980 [Deltaproteobacteria bacterium]|nr:MAG: hypothetical protein E6J91_40415 [Deltaproteobacteria bacterium]TMQ07626.1 MAG: hypothetical protein E6J90_42980 [Deltaproteobacteria bacterium]